MILAVDTASAEASVAVVDAGQVLAVRRLPQRETAEGLLPAILAVLAAGAPGLAPRDALAALAGIVAIQGPGSFTGLRIGLATVLGLHRALDVPATAVSTLLVLAAAARQDNEAKAPLDPGAGGGIVAAVDALRDSWFVQRFAPSREPAAAPQALAPPERVGSDRLAGLGPGLLVGHGVTRLTAAQRGDLAAVEPPALAPTAGLLAAAGAVPWDAALLSHPLYLADANVTLPRAAPRQS